MISRRQFLTLSASLASAAMLSACGLRKVEGTGEGEAAQEAQNLDVSGQRLSVAVTGEPNSVILDQYCQPVLAELGLTLETKIYIDAQRAHTDCERARIDCCFLENKAELNRYKRQRTSSLEVVAPVIYNPMCVYSKKHDNLREAPLGASVALPQDLAGQGHALQVLSQERMVTLANPGALAANTDDVVENPRELELTTMAQDELTEALYDYDYAVIPLPMAQEADLHVRDAVAIEANDGIAAQWYASSLVTDAARSQDARIQTLLAVLHSEGLSQFLRDRFDLDVIQISVIA